MNLLSQGLLDAASRAAMSAIEEARTTNQPTVLCVALAFAAGFIFLSLDEQDTANIYGEELVAHAYKHALRPVLRCGPLCRGSLAGRRGEAATGVDLFRSGLDEMRMAIYLLFDPFFRMEFVMALGAIGRVDHGIREIDEALRNPVETDYRSFVPENSEDQRTTATTARPDGSPSIEDLFRQTMMQARAQKAAYWELSAATSLVELLRSQHREVEARAILSPVYNRVHRRFFRIESATGQGFVGSIGAMTAPTSGPTQRTQQPKEI